MRRININIKEDDVSDEQAISLVSSVINLGKISADGEKYCYVTVFDDGITVLAERTRAGNETFTITRNTRAIREEDK